MSKFTEDFAGSVEASLSDTVALAELTAAEEAAAYITKKERDALPESDFGWPEERKYPVRNQSDLDSAVKLIGKAPESKRSAIKKNLTKIAKRKGLSVPESWSN